MLLEQSAAGCTIVDTGDSALETWRQRGGLNDVTQAIWLDLDAEPDAPEEARLLRTEFGIDPMALQRYEQSLQRLKDYNQMLEKANNLSVPVFNQKRFMYMIGYDTLINQNPEV